MSDYQTIDITDWKQTGDELKTEIYNAVKDTQRTIVRDLPHTLIMTPSQFTMLSDDDEMLVLPGIKDRMWKTDMNVMEIEVREP